MIIAIDPDTKQHGCAMGFMLRGQPRLVRTWTIRRMDRRGNIHPNYREGLLDLFALAKQHDALVICEDAFLGKSPLTFRRLIEARCEITVPLFMDNWKYDLVSPSVWMGGIGIATTLGRAEIETVYCAFARKWARASGIYEPDSSHECAAMGILWWALTTKESQL